MTPCSIPHCKRPAMIELVEGKAATGGKPRALCQFHWNRYNRTGKLDDEEVPQENNNSEDKGEVN